MTQLACVLGALCGLAFYGWARALTALARVERERDEARDEVFAWRRQHNERALRSGRGGLYAVPTKGRGPYAAV
jgi:hypothetical protein